MFNLESTNGEDTRHLLPESPPEPTHQPESPPEPTHQPESPPEPTHPSADCSCCAGPNLLDDGITPTVTVPPPPLAPHARHREPWYNLQGDMMGWYIRTVTIRQVPIHVHPLLPILWIAATFQGLIYGVVGVMYSFLLYGPILWAMALIHELGHALVARQLGQEVHRILLWPLGGLAYIGHSETATPRDDILISLAGPLAHVSQIWLWWVLARASGGVYWDDVFLSGSLFSMVCSGAMRLIVMLLFFNLCLPCYPLDGGRILVAAMLMNGASVKTTAQACAFTSALMAGMGLFFIAIATMDLLLFLLTAWVVFQVYQVCIMLHDGIIHDHPLFQHVSTTSSAEPSPQRQPAGPEV